MTASTDDPRVNDALADLRAWSDALPTYDVEAGAARHVDLVGQGAAPAGATAVVRGSRRAWWIVGGSAVIALGLAGAWPRALDAPRAPESVGVDRAVTEAAPAPAPFVPERIAVAAPGASDAIADSPDDVAAAAVAAPPSRRARVAAERKPPTPGVEAPGAATADDELERELAIVRRMRGALADEPRRVLELAAEADRDVGRGVFAEERAALRVFALARLDDSRTDGAAAAFLREFGDDGPFAGRVARVARDEAPNGAVQ